MIAQRIIGIGVGLTIAIGCGSGVDVGAACDDYGAPAILVALADSATAGRIPSGFVNARAVDGVYADSASGRVEQLSSEQVIPLAFERPGTYRVDVNVTGYRPWTMSGIVVAMESDGCHVSTRSVRALLQRGL